MLFMDEAVFTSNQVNPKIWYIRQKSPVMISKKKLSFKAIAVAAAVDVDGKLVAYLIKDKSIDKFAFVDFLKEVSKHTKYRKCSMLVDNLGVHYTDLVKQEAKERKIELIYNGTYSSEFNPIERLWAWSK